MGGFHAVIGGWLFFFSVFNQLFHALGFHSLTMMTKVPIVKNLLLPLSFLIFVGGDLRILTMTLLLCSHKQLCLVILFLKKYYGFHITTLGFCCDLLKSIGFCHFAVT